MRVFVTFQPGLKITRIATAKPHVDYDRDCQVNATDVLLARNNQTTFFNALNLIDLSSVVAKAQGALPANLAWFSEFNQPAVYQRPAQKDAAADAIDKLLATYWP